jgi:hypothetical protein
MSCKTSKAGHPASPRRLFVAELAECDRHRSEDTLLAVTGAVCVACVLCVTFMLRNPPLWLSFKKAVELESELYVTPCTYLDETVKKVIGFANTSTTFK